MRCGESCSKRIETADDVNELRDDVRLISLRVPVMSFRFAGWLSILLFFSLTTRAQRAVPELWGMRVHDEARILSSTTVHNLENQLEQFEDSTTNQIAVLIIPSLESVLEQYSLSVVEKWQLGKRGEQWCSVVDCC